MPSCPLLLRADPRLPLIAQSHARLTGQHLIKPAADPADALWSLPSVLIAHGSEADPIFFFGNAKALELFALPLEKFIALPSRLSAEAGLRAERAVLLERVSAHGFVDDYSGVRISATGQRFCIHQATVWNLMDEAGQRHGQAAVFSQWTLLP